MSDMPVTSKYQLNELLTLVNSEIWSVITAIGSQSQPEARLLVDSIKVRLGQVPLEETAPEDSGDLLDISRYGVDGKSWLLSLDYRFDDTRPKVTSPAGTVSVLPIPNWRTAAVFFAPLPVHVIKGVDDVWTDNLRGVGVQMVGQLSNLSDAALKLAIIKFSSAIPVELRTKARLAGTEFPPVPASAADMLSLYELALKTPEELRSLMNPLMPVMDVRSFSSFLAVLLTVIDWNILRKTPLGRIREVVENAS